MTSPGPDGVAWVQVLIIVRQINSKPGEDHKSGIARCKEMIKAGKKLRPILVASNGQRLDGFKRYMAHKELGHKTIEVIVDPNGRMGGQDGQAFNEE